MVLGGVQVSPVYRVTSAAKLIEATMIWLALLFGLLCTFGGPQSGVLAQEGGKFSYPRALERIELVVVSLNESLYKTQEDLQEVKLCLNQTKKQLGEVQRDKESLEAQLLETRDELAATKTLHQQAIDELKATQDSSRVEALEDGLRQVRIRVGDLEDEEFGQRVAEQESSVSSLFDSLLTQVNTTNNLTRTVAEQGYCIAHLKQDVERIKIGKLCFMEYFFTQLFCVNWIAIQNGQLNA